MRALFFVLGLGVAAYLQVFGGRSAPEMPALVDPFLVVVLWASLGVRNPASALFAGSAGGLARDALTGGRLGLHGFADTLVAWMLHGLLQRFVVQSTVQIGALFSLVAAVQQTVLALLELAFVARPELPGLVSVVGIVVSTGVLGGCLVEASDRLGGWLQVRSERRRKRLGLETRS